MSKELQIFNNPEFGDIRTVVIDCEPWMVGKDVCAVFGDKNHNRSLGRVDTEDKRMVFITDSMGRTQQITIINESGLYALLFAMQPQKANKGGVSDAYPIEIQERINRLRKFKRWVTSEVLPAIRKTGGYIPTDGADDKEILARAVLIAQKTIEEKDKMIARQKEKIAADAPAVAFANDVGSCKDNLTVEKFAKATFDRFGLGRNKMHAWLRENKFLTAKRVPFQKYIDAGWFSTFEELRNGYPVVVTTITGKGQRKLYDKLAEAFPA